MTSYTVGVAGDFINWRAAWDYLRTVDPLADDYEFMQISDVTENAWISPVGAELDLQEHTVRFYCPWATSHQGDPTQGHVTYLTGANGRIWLMNLAGPLDPGTQAQSFIVENLYLRQLKANHVVLLDIGPSWANGGNLTAIVNNVMIRGFSTAQADGLRVGSDLVYARVYNCKVWNLAEGIVTWGGVGGVATPGRRFLENCTVGEHGSTGINLGTLAGCEWDVKNCVAISGDGGPMNPDWQNANYFRHTVSNCASQDATVAGANALPNIVPANEFEYYLLADDNQSEFLNLDIGTIAASFTREPAGNVLPKQKIKFDPTITFGGGSASLGGGGIVPTYATADIKGNTIPNINSEYPVGCHIQEYV